MEKSTTNETNQVKVIDQTLRPTKKQKELLAYIEQFIAEHGYSPSYREIMNGLQYNSVATVALHVGNLIKRGHIRKRDRSARSLEVVQMVEKPPLLQTNEVKPAEEKWLVEQVERLLTAAEAEPTDTGLADIYVVLAALRIIGLDGAAGSFMQRLQDLKRKFDNMTTPS